MTVEQIDELMSQYFAAMQPSQLGVAKRQDLCELVRTVPRSKEVQAFITTISTFAARDGHGSGEMLFTAGVILGVLLAEKHI